MLVCLFENNNKKNARNGMTVSETASTTNLTSEEVYEAMNHLDIKLNDYSEEERYADRYNPSFNASYTRKEIFKNIIY